ncbi:MAG TPA: hypothetical protein VNE67_17195 [Acetobacteraceae bacterium]|nr:hypothetical protein [Stellaceae bacterium]HVB69587.1 hypothetical protein [Acetobacteraceae bacterium]
MTPRNGQRDRWLPPLILLLVLSVLALAFGGALLHLAHVERAARSCAQLP